MEMIDYLENVPNIAATVCDKDGIVLYQNKRAIDRDGGPLGFKLSSTQPGRFWVWIIIKKEQQM